LDTHDLIAGVPDLEQLASEPDDAQREPEDVSPENVPADFNESAYAIAFPDVAESVRVGKCPSFLAHYTRHGAGENRLSQKQYQIALRTERRTQDVTLRGVSAPESDRATASGLDAVFVADGDFCVVIGWIDDRVQPLRAISLELSDGQRITTTCFGRCRRADAEVSTGGQTGYLLGFWSLLPANLAPSAANDSVIILTYGGASSRHPARPRVMPATTLRDTLFEYIASATYFGAPAVESFLQLGGGIGSALLEMNRRVSAHFAEHPHVERHGRHDRKFRASIVICLYGRPEFIFLQAALYSVTAAAKDYEFVYVCNSPELTEPLQREAAIACRIYGLSMTMIYLPGNVGFGAANNLAVSIAASRRILIVNPDVFPRESSWAERHTQIIDSLPALQTRLFGAPLFYDDGSLMHGGMFFEVDAGLSVKPECIVRQELLRVEHYGKGAPPNTPLYRSSRRVPAVSGAFMSVDRPWFEKLGGFSEEFVFGHYEDADLCLKAWQSGGEVWLHDLPLWHLEGKGSIRRINHEGGSLVNRWHFTKTWLDTVIDEFHGPSPRRFST
jgi:GT2 family glycosyltransferase